ncbi:MAG: TonB-dependent receptor [Chitinophagales bacterium]|nr:TonB-dependent receptor [Chitinophagales bacterium]
MKNYILTVLIVIAHHAFAQHVLQGVVVNEKTQEPVTGATIQLKETFSGTTTDVEGKFSIHSKKENATLIISHLSFETQEVDATATELRIALKEKSFLADEVIVSATRANKTTAPSFTEVTKDEIKKQNLAQDIPYLIDQTPSVVTTSDAGAGVGYTYLRIRGSNQSRINVTVNGIPYNEAESQEVYWVDLPDFASSVDNIQIQRGVGTSTNGASAFGGSINIQTTGLQREPFGEISGSYGSFNTWKATARFGTGLIKNKFTFDGRLSQIKSDGYVDRASSDLKSYFVSGGYYGAKTILRINVFSGLEETFQAWYGVPESYLDTIRTYNYYNYPNEVDHYKQDHYQIIFSREANDYWTINSALHFTRGKGYYEQYRGPEYNNDFGFNGKESFADYGLPDLVLEDTTITETSLARRRWLSSYFYGCTFSTLYQKKKTTLTFGGAANRYNGNHSGEVIWAEYAGNIPQGYLYYDSDGIKNDVNVYGKMNYQPLKRMNVFLDLQYRFVSHEIAGTDNDRRIISIDEKHHFFNPKLGVSFTPNTNHELYASFAIGNREPARADYLDAPTNVIPEPERLRDLEAGYRFIKAKNLLSVNYYFMHYKNQLVLTGELNDVGSPVKTNVDKSSRTGIEVMNSFKPVKQLQWDVNLTYSMNKIKEFTEVVYVYDADYNFIEAAEQHYSNTDISFSPFLIAGSTIAYSPVEDLQFAFINKYVSNQFLDNTGNDTRNIDGYFLGNFRINYSLKKKFFEEILFTVLLNNIFNTSYESNGYVYSEIYTDEFSSRTRADYTYYYPQAKFNVMGGVTVRF